MNNEIPPPYITSRKLAIENNYMYFHGAPCKKFNHTLRYATGHCVECMRAKMAKPEFRLKKAKYRASEAGKTVTKKYNLKYYELNRDTEIERAKVYQKNNPDKALASKRRNSAKSYLKTKEWRKNNVDKCRIHEKDRRSRKIGNGGTHTVKEINELLIKQNYKCLNCNTCIQSPSSRHLDHILPLILGGTNNKSNLQWLCKQCNLRKKDKHPIDWAQQNGRLC